MDNISPEVFNNTKRDAEERMMKMRQNGMTFPSFVKLPENKETEHSPPAPPPREEKQSTAEKQTNGRFPSLLRYINLPEMLQNSDGILLLALILLLSEESADESLILALAYILL